MRNLDADEQATLRSGHCVFCRYEQFHLGPQGGLSFNIYCAFRHCRAGYNVTHEKLPWQLIALPGERDVEELIMSKPMSLTLILDGITKAVEHTMTSMRDAMAAKGKSH